MRCIRSHLPSPPERTTDFHCRYGYFSDICECISYLVGTEYRQRYKDGGDNRLQERSPVENAIQAACVSAMPMKKRNVIHVFGF